MSGEAKAERPASDEVKRTTQEKEKGRRAHDRRDSFKQRSESTERGGTGPDETTDKA